MRKSLAAYSKHLLIISLILSIASFFTIRSGGKEIYPFFSWALFSYPSGNEESHTSYFLYGIKSNDTARINITADSKLFGPNTQASIINYYSSRIDNKHEIKKSTEKLLVFSKRIAPDFDKYVIYKETINPHLLSTKNFLIDKRIIAEIK